MSGSHHNHTILYAEDDHDDLFMVRHAFTRYDGEITLIHANDGFEALEQLKIAEEKNVLPCLIVLDINMPGMDGKEALVQIKSHERYKNIPVVLFTTSSSDRDKAFAERWDAQFITKPLVFSELEQMVHRFIDLCTTSLSAKV